MQKSVIFLLCLLLTPALCVGETIRSKSVRVKTLDPDVPLSSAVRGGGGGGHDANCWSSYWTFIGAITMKTASNAKLNAPQTGDASFSVVVGFMPDAYSFQGVISKGTSDGSGNLEWWFHLNSNKDVVSRYSNDGSTIRGGVYGDLYYAGAKSILMESWEDVGADYDWLVAGIPDSTGTGTISSTLTSSQTKPVYEGGGDFRLGAASSGISYLQGKLYFVAIYHNNLSIQDMEDIYDGTKHPADDFEDDITFYIDFHQKVGSTYTSEIGNITFSISGTGTPVAGP